MTFPQVTFFCITGASTISPLPDYILSKNCCKFMKNISYLQIYLILNVIFLKGYSIEYPGFLSGTSQRQKGNVLSKNTCVRMVGLEPTRPSGHDILSVACLPIPSHPLVLLLEAEGYLLIVFNELNQERFELWNKPKHTLYLIFFHPEGLKF